MAAAIVLCKVIVLLFVLMALVCCKGEAQPVRVKARVKGEKVVVKWKGTAHSVPESGGGQKHQGLLLVIQEQSAGSLPQFVPVASHTKKAKITGLKPDSFYKLKVMEYTDDAVMTSSSITLDTKGLRVPMASGLTVEGVGSEHFVLAWQHNLTEGIQEVFFNANCTGARPNSSESRDMSLGQTGLFAHRGIVVLRDRASVKFEHVKPDMIYTCAVQTRFNNSDARSTSEDTVSVHTLPAKPSRPPIPKVVIEREANKHTKRLFIEVKPATTENGRISHYLVIAVPMHKRAEGTFTPVVPMGSLVSKALTPELVSKAKVPVPFTLCTIKPNALPMNITVDFSQSVSTVMAFRSDELYSFTTVAFSYQNGQNASNSLYTASSLSFPPTAIHRITTVTDDVSESHVRHLVSILVAVLSISGLLVLVSVGALLSWLLYRRCATRHKAYRKLPWWETDDDDDEEEEEEGTVYTARPKLKNEVRVRKMPSLGSRPHPSADDLLFNPAFDDGSNLSKNAEEDLHSMLEQMKTYQRPATASTAELSLPDVKDGSFCPPQTPIMPRLGRPTPKRAKFRLKNVARRLKPKPVAVPPHSLRRSSSAPEIKGL